MVMLGVSASWGQYAGPALTSPPVAAGAGLASAVEIDATRIVPGDVISITTLGAPELTLSGSAGGILSGVRIGNQGEFEFPYLGSVKLAGMSEEEAAQYLRKALKEGGFLADPQVIVEIVNSPTRVVTMIGELQHPQPVPAFASVRLLDAVSLCGGFTNFASHTLTVQRAGVAEPLTVELGNNPRSSSLSDILLRAGDTVIVPRVGNVYVMGEVKTVGAIPLSSNTPITVMRAIILSGGLKFPAARGRASIIRTTPDNQRIEIRLDLKKVVAGKEPDVALLSDDVLYVPTNRSKAIMAAGGAQIFASLLYQGLYSYELVR